MTSHTETVTVGDGSFDLAVWLPEAGRGPGILLIEEIFGVGPYIKAVAEDLAGRGYVVAAPDLFWRLHPGWVAEHTPEGVRASMGLTSRFDMEKGVADAAAALAHLRGKPEVTGKTGVLGFCFGGTIAYLVGVHTDPDAVVSFYGSGVPGAAGEMGRVTCPLLFHFGGNDPYIPRDEVAKVERAAEGLGHVRVLVEEDAGHAFHNFVAPMFHNPEAGERAWARTLDWLARELPVG